jgi:hypothetical protein
MDIDRKDLAQTQVEEVGYDHLLEVFANLAQETGMEMGLTVTVPGAIVTGTLIGRDAWLRQFVQDTEHNSMGKQIGEALQRYYEELDLNQSADIKVWDYLHLRDAYYVGPRRIPDQPPGFLWRARIFDISSWTLGRLGP